MEREIRQLVIKKCFLKGVRGCFDLLSCFELDIFVIFCMIRILVVLIYYGSLYQLVEVELELIILFQFFIVVE